MTIQAQGSVYSQVFVPRDYDMFAGLDVDHHSIAATFTDHDRLMQSLRLPYSAPQLLNYVRKHFPQQWVAFVYEAGPTGFGLYDELEAARADAAERKTKAKLRRGSLHLDIHIAVDRARRLQTTLESNNRVGKEAIRSGPTTC